MLNSAKRFFLREPDRYRTIVKTIRLPRLRLDYGFSIVLIVAGLLGATVNLLPSPETKETRVSSVIEPAQDNTTNPSVDRAIPTRLEIPTIGVSTDLITLDKNADGTLETPDRYDIAGWYKYSPTPGEIGPAIITGHVDTYLGPAVFFDLKELQQGNPVRVTRDDGSVVDFVVDKIEVFDQDAFPTQEVYGNIDYAGLRLITCGGNYNVLSGRYSHNVVVYASYIAS